MDPIYMFCVSFYGLIIMIITCWSASGKPDTICRATTIAALATGVMTTYYGFTAISCNFNECCTNSWVNLNDTELSLNLRNQIYGQHIVLKTVVPLINAHMSNENPAETLVLSFHGGPGTGKTFVSEIIANNIYREGMKSQFVHLFVSTRDFIRHDLVKRYKNKLRYFLETSLNNCERSMFVFDEMDKMPLELLKTLKPYLDNYDSRKAIFIFLSNTGGTEIAKTTLDALLAKRKRETIQLNDIRELIATSAANSKTSGFIYSDLLLSHVISAYIPFLPLERKHIRMCITDYLLKTKYYKTCALIEEEKVLEIEEELHYFPDKEQIFSSTGCKRVKEKTEFVIGDD